MRIVVSGYASLDYAVRLDSPATPDRTSTILSRPKEWPRLGGSPAYVCAALAGAGVRDATPISWVADDAEGAFYREALGRLGVKTEGVRTRPGRTPVCLLAYQPDGGCVCLYDRGVELPIALDDTQRALIAGADAYCATVGSPEATREALTLLRPEAIVVWVVKADPRATPPDLAAALASRADIIVHSRGEAPFVAEAARTAALVRRAVRIETRGAEGVSIHAAGGVETIPVEPLDVEDTTGAGDAWVGGFLAAHIAGGAPLLAAAQEASRSVRAMLAARAEQTRT